MNNLNLMATSPTGHKYVGNQSKAGATSFDTRNNVEGIQVAKASAGDWKIEVIAGNTPFGPQDFAIVAIGAF